MKQADGKEPQRFQKLVTLFHELHEKREDERAAIIEETRASDPDLAAEVERMLSEVDDVESFLETPPFGEFRSRMPEVSPGNIFGHYRILSELGSGGMGIVYLAEDSRLNRRVALKFLAPHLVGYGQSRERFVKEAQAAAALRHQNVCPVYEIGESEGRAYIVMALLEGQTLAQRIVNGPMAVRGAVTIALDIGAALEAAHAKGIVHQDVKPANLMIATGGDGQDHATLMDFGLARMADLSHHTGEKWIAGTVSYMSPERVAGAQVDRRTDLWSLGVILFEMLTGQKPFRGANDSVVLHAIRNENPGAPSALQREIPKELDDIVAKALANRLEKRYSTATEVIGDLRRLEQTLDAAHGPRPRMVSRRWMVGSAALACCGAAGYFWQRHAKREPVRLLVNDGNSRDPVFSLDGSQIVFSWKPPAADHFQLYLLGDRGGEPRRLTDGPADDSDPAWSPDGTHICFTRQGLGESALYVKLLRDGVERRVTTLINSDYSNRLDWLDANRTVVLAENWFNMPLTFVDVESGTRRQVMPPAPAGYNSPRLSPNRKWIAVTQFFGQTTADLFIVPASGGGEARRITFDHYAKRDHRWTPDGRGILYRAPDKKSFAWWYVPMEGGTPRAIGLPDFTVGSFDIVGESVGTVELVAAERKWTIGVSRMQIPAPGEPPSPAVPLILSAGNDSLDANPAISPDGLRVAFVSTRSGHPEIWTTSYEGRGAEQLTTFNGPEVTQPGWSPDGRYLISATAPQAKRNLFRVDVATRSLRWLTTSGLEETEPQWSRDGQWITFASSRSGRQELWRMPADGGTARQLTHQGGAVSRESPDGRWIYYVRHEQPGLWRVPAKGGRETIVLNRVASELYRAWAVGRKGVYYTSKNESSNTWAVALYDPQNNTERPLAHFDKPLARWSGTLALSPDERWMLLPIRQAEGSKIMLFSGLSI